MISHVDTVIVLVTPLVVTLECSANFYFADQNQDVV